jgi:hypothetical protein
VRAGLPLNLPVFLSLLSLDCARAYFFNQKTIVKREKYTFIVLLLCGWPVFITLEKEADMVVCGCGAVAHVLKAWRCFFCVAYFVGGTTGAGCESAKNTPIVATNMQ